MKNLTLAIGIFFSMPAISNTIEGYSHPIFICNGCTVEEIEQRALSEAKIDTLHTVAIVDTFAGKAFTYQVEKYMKEESDGVRFLKMITPIDNEKMLDEGAHEAYMHHVKLWNLNSDAMKALKIEKAKTDKDIFTLEQ